MEEKIQLAMAQGAFDDLKGKGKPLERYSEGASMGRWMHLSPWAGPTLGGSCCNPTSQSIFLLRSP